MPLNGGGGWRGLAHEAFDPADRHLRVADAIAGMLAATSPLVVGLLLDRPHAGLMAALGGLNVALSMAPGRPDDRAPWGVVTLLVATALTALATAVHPVVWLSAVVAFVAIALASLLRVLGPRGALVGFVVSAVLLIANGLPGSTSDAPERAGEFFVGGLGALALMMLAGLADGPDRRTTDRLAWRSVPGVVLDAVRADGAARRYAVVLGATVAATTLTYRFAGLAFGYWIPLTALAVLQPDAHSSRVRLVQRGSGTVLGCLVVAMAVAVSASDSVLVGAVAVTSFGLFALRQRSYHWFVTLLTPTALLMISTVDFEGSDIAVERVIDTAIGLMVALAVLRVVAPARPGRARRGSPAPGPPG